MHIYKSKLSGINDNEITQILSTTWTLQFTSLLVGFVGTTDVFYDRGCQKGNEK